MASTFSFYFLFLFERARHFYGAFGDVCTAGQCWQSLTLAQEFLSSVQLKKGFRLSWDSKTHLQCHLRQEANVSKLSVWKLGFLCLHTHSHPVQNQLAPAALTIFKLHFVWTSNLVTCLLKEIERLQLFARALCDRGSL